jgi:hypothetical protein
VSALLLPYWILLDVLWTDTVMSVLVVPPYIFVAVTTTSEDCISDAVPLMIPVAASSTMPAGSRYVPRVKLSTKPLTEGVY